VLPPEPASDRPGRRSRLLVALLVAAAILALAALLAYPFRSELPLWPGPNRATPGPTEPHLTPAPIATGQAVVPGPGATPEEAADTMPLQRPSFPYTGSQPWQIAVAPDATRVLEGYASRPSYLPGEALRLAVSTTAPFYDVQIFRVSGRAPVAGPFVQVASIAGQPGRLQPPPMVDPVTKLVAARWRYDFVFAIPTSWRSGIYLVRLSSSQGVQSYVPFVLRSPSAHRILVVSSAMNWEAYNRWGGSSVYTSQVGDPFPGVHRALGVSFDRPYASDGGAGQLFFLELPFVSWILRQHLDVAFTTDYDLSLHPDAQPLPRVVVFNGHDEYWGVRLYQWLDRHVNQLGDVGLAMLAADTGYWPVQFTHETADGPRDMLVFKNGPVPASLLPPGETPEPTASGAPEETASPPGEIEERSSRILWTIPAHGPYVGSLPDQPIFGVHYQGVTTALGRYSLVEPGAQAPGGSAGGASASWPPGSSAGGPPVGGASASWAPGSSAGGPPVSSTSGAASSTFAHLLAGTGLGPGDSLGFIAGGEVDGVNASSSWWGPLGGRHDHLFAVAALIPGRTPQLRWTAEAVWRELPNGGRVFSSGTFYWGWALDPAWGRAHEVPRGFGQLTLNILAFLGGA
jgi:hypothetical protein